ncbi:MAG TPA: septum formation initiator family protein [Vicinamibacterales bacterium]|nr:septum formation initiator family protein [Vicinamibacterales bacterium]
MPTPAAPDAPVAPLAPRHRENPWLRRALLFVTCVVLADALVGDRGLGETIRARREYRLSAAAVTALRDDNAALREQVRDLQGDPDAIEAIARKELGLIRPGEVLFLLKRVQ